MSPQHFFALYQAETDRLFRRMTSIIGLSLSALFGVIGPLLILLMNIIGYQAFQAMAEGVPPEDLVEFQLASWDFAVFTSYYLRNFMFLPILIFLLGGLSMASEFVARTVREDVLRPVPRWALLLAKWCALASWILAATALIAGLSVVLGLLLTMATPSDPEAWKALEGLSGGEWFSGATSAWWAATKPALIQIGITLATDLGFATLALAVAVVTRSVAATVAGLVMVFMVQFAVSIGFGVATLPFTRELAPQVLSQWVPPDAWTSIFDWIEFFSRWQPPFVLGSCTYAELTPESFVTLSVITLGSLAMGLLVFERMDVP